MRELQGLSGPGSFLCGSVTRVVEGPVGLPRDFLCCVLLVGSALMGGGSQGRQWVDFVQILVL